MDFLENLEPTLWFKNPIFDKKSSSKGMICPLRTNFGQP